MRAPRSGSKRIYFWLLAAVASALAAGRFSYLALLRVGEIREFQNHFRYYPILYLFIFVVGFAAISFLYLYLLSRLGGLSIEAAASADLPVSLFFLFLLPYVIAFRYSLDSFGYVLLYLTLVSVLAARIYLLMSSISRNRPREERFHYQSLVVVFLVAAALRLLLLLTSSRLVDSDEAIWGLMARHIIFLGEHPSLFYGQPYMGSLSAYFAALLFFVFGASSVVLKLVPLSYSFFFLLTTYLLVKKIFSAKAALVSLLLVAAGPAFFIFYNVTQWGYMEAIVIGNVILLLLVGIIGSPSTGRKAFFLYSALGLAMGIGFWLSVFVTAYIITALIFVLAKERLSFFGWKFLLLGGFFLLGLLPLIVFNLHSNFATWEFLAQSGGQSGSIPERLQWTLASGKALLANALPGLLGIRGKTIYTSFVLYSIYSYLAALAIALSTGRLREGNAAGQNRARILYVLASVTIVSFLLSRVAAIYQIPRYLISLYSVVPALLGASLVHLLRRWKPAGVSLLAVILAVNVSGTLGASQTVPPNVAGLAESLERVGAERALANYWTAYQLTFISKEKVVCASHSGDWSHRYPEYNNQFDGASLSKKALVFPLRSRDISSVKKRLDWSGITYSEAASSGYIILYRFSRAFTGEDVPVFEVGADPRVQLGN